MAAEQVHLIDATMGGLLEKWTREMPDHDFMVYPDRGLRFSYAEFNERVNNFAKGLMELGVKKTAKSAYGQRTFPTG